MSAVLESSSPQKTAIKRGRFAVNVVANVANFGLAMIVGICFVPYLIHHLGTAAYGLIPLATTMTAYMALITLGLNSAVGRSITIALEEGNEERARLVFNTSFVGSLILTGALLGPALWMAMHTDWFLRVPPGYEGQARWLFVCTIFAFLLNEIKTPFDVATFCHNRFDLRNLVSVCETTTRVGLVVLLFQMTTPRLWHMGLGILAGAIVSSLGAIRFWRLLTPTLHVSVRNFDWGVLRSLTSTGGWVIVNQIGAILFLSIDLLVINRLLGAEASGRYAAVMQLPLTLRYLAAAIQSVFTPTILYLFARKDITGLIAYARRAVKFIGLLLALPISLLCGLSEPILRLWLGPKFGSLAPLLTLMSAHLCVNLAIMPLLNLQLATDSMRVPGIVTMLMGLCNLGLALLLAGPMHWGLYGVAAAGAITLTGKNIAFTPLYAAHILRRGYGTFFREMLPIMGMTAMTVGLCRLALLLEGTLNWSRLLASILVIAAVYLILVYRVLLSAQEREALWSMLPFAGRKR
ncbi:MAG TPA: oligosaccharide flippase family protein [Chthonomonadaceae bacterium]|nr:oligosaccharide flippase family protein [Chthonomonadaceae bacterium]